MAEQIAASFLKSIIPLGYLFIFYAVFYFSLEAHSIGNDDDDDNSVTPQIILVNKIPLSRFVSVVACLDFEQSTHDLRISYMQIIIQARSN